MAHQLLNNSCICCASCGEVDEQWTSPWRVRRNDVSCIFCWPAHKKYKQAYRKAYDYRSSKINATKK